MVVSKTISQKEEMIHTRDIAYTLVTTERSGSEWIGQTINQYLTTKYGYKGWLGEPFHVWEPNITRDVEYVIDDDIIKMVPGKVLITNPEERAKNLRALISGNEHNYFFKNLALDLRYAGHFGWLSQRYRCIFLNRLNKKEQFLSLALMVGGLPAHSPEGNLLPKQKMTVPTGRMPMFKYRIWVLFEAYQKYCELFPSEPALVLNYEEVVSDLVGAMSKIFPDFEEFFDPIHHKGLLQYAGKNNYEVDKLDYTENRDYLETILKQERYFFEKHSRLV
jgi:hypothetical protein